MSGSEAAYGGVTKTLHWLTVAAVVAQFTVGYSLDVDAARAADVAVAEAEGRGRGRGRGGDDRLDVFGDDTLLTVHVALGVSILVLAIVRLA